jgi:hypothetical protein
MSGYVHPTEQLVIEIVTRDIRRSVDFYRPLEFGLLRDSGNFVVLTWEDHQLPCRAVSVPRGRGGGVARASGVSPGQRPGHGRQRRRLLAASVPTVPPTGSRRHGHQSNQAKPAPSSPSAAAAYGRPDHAMMSQRVEECWIVRDTTEINPAGRRHSSGTVSWRGRVTPRLPGRCCPRGRSSLARRR